MTSAFASTEQGGEVRRRGGPSPGGVAVATDEGRGVGRAERRAGRDVAFDAFWAAHHDRVQRALALATGDVALGAEAADEAFTRAYQRWGQVREMASPAGWCYRVGLNWSISWRRKLSRRPTLPIEALDRAAPADVHADIDPVLVAALAALTSNQRTAVVARHYLDMSIPDVAELLGTSETTTRTHVHRGLTRLRAALEERDLR